MFGRQAQAAVQRCDSLARHWNSPEAQIHVLVNFSQEDWGWISLHLSWVYVQNNPYCSSVIVCPCLLLGCPFNTTSSCCLYCISCNIKNISWCEKPYYSIYSQCFFQKEIKICGGWEKRQYYCGISLVCTCH